MVEDDFGGLVAALDGKQRGREWVCRCPAHDDAHPSLYVRKNDEGRILFRCFSGCTQDEVFTAVRSMGFLKGHAAPKKFSLPRGVPTFWPPASVLKKKNLKPSPETQKAYVAHWPYRDASGEIVGHVVRYEGHDKKDLVPFFRHWDDGGWRSGLPEGRRPLYNEHLISQAITIAIVEGEKTAEAASRIDGVLGVAWLGGSSTVSKSDWSVLQNNPLAVILIIPDLDHPGFQAALALGEIFPDAMFVDPRALGLSESGADLADLETLPDLEALMAPAVMFDPEVVASLSPPKPKKVKKEKTVQAPLPAADVPRSTIPSPLLSVENPSEDMVLDTLNDVGNARRFMSMYGDSVRYVKEHGWYTYNGEQWEQDDAAVGGKMIDALETVIPAEAMSVSCVRARDKLVKWGRLSVNHSKLTAALKTSWDLGLTTRMDAFDADPNLLSVSNGVFDLSSGDFRPNRKQDLITRKCSVEYHPDAWCPRWVEFLREIMLGDEETISYLQRAIGYSLTGNCSEQVMFLLWGSGANGKSVFLETLRVLLGSYATNTSTDLILLDSRGDAASQSHLIARLKGARFVVGSEVPSGAKLNESRVKEMTGEDTLTARFLYRDAFDFKPQFKLWVRSNYRPDVNGRDQGIWRRLHTIPFEASIAPDKQDKKLQKKLLDELPGILNWAILGYHDWREQGLAVPERVTAANNSYKKDMDVLGDWLDERCIDVERPGATRGATLLEDFLRWSEHNGDLKNAPSPRQFGTWLRDRNYLRVKKSDGVHYLGIALKNPGYFVN